MWETRAITLDFDLPEDIAKQALEIQVSEPDYLSRIVLYGLTRESIYKRLLEQRVEEDLQEDRILDGIIKYKLVSLNLRLPRDVADYAEKTWKKEEGFALLNRVVLYGIVRRNIYRYLRESDEVKQ